VRCPPDKHKPPGQKPGHPGCCRKEPDHIDQTIELPLDNCPICSRPVKDIKRTEQVIEENRPFDPTDCAKHKCIAHHLRAISKAMKFPCTDDHEYLLSWRSFFHGVIALYRLRESLSEAEFINKRKAMEDWRQQLLSETVSQPGDVAVRNRLLKQRKHLLGCFYEPAAEPTNNHAERALRPAVIAHKVSCGNKTERGRDCWQILSSIGASCQQQMSDFVELLSSQLPLSAVAG
jgi:transposase